MNRRILPRKTGNTFPERMMTVKELNQMTLTFSARSVNESFARVAAASFLSQLDPTLQELAEIKTIVSEAVTNCIVHGYAEGTGRSLKETRSALPSPTRGGALPTSPKP